MTAPVEVPRDALVGELVRRAQAAPPAVLAGPPGAGKSTLLREAARALERTGWRPVLLDLLGAASTPERFVTAALRALPADGFGARLHEAVAIRRLAERGRLHGQDAVRALFDFLASAAEAGGRRVALLLDEATEIRSLAYFPGLRRADQLLADALRARAGGTLLATSLPSLARTMWGFDEVTAAPLDAAELAPVLREHAPHVDPSALRAASCGWPRYVRILMEEAAGGAGLESAWAACMSPGGRLEQACRATYETLLLRSRGYGVCKAVLAVVADEAAPTLTTVVARLGRTPGATRDYLQWLVGVDLLRMERKRYTFVDRLVRQWVRLHASGVTPDEATVRRHLRELLAAPTAADDGSASVEPAPATKTAGGGAARAGDEPDQPEAPGPADAAAARRDADRLMEID